MSEQIQYKVDPMVIQSLKDKNKFNNGFFYKTNIDKSKIEKFLNGQSTMIHYDTACVIAKELDMNWKMLIML
ncbi:MAG TPA: hypothetical protein VK108_11615 [Pseudogracilibacillus sp.]|nr:hypothetical protein [Pseudogracilibacillus sp.]